MEELAAGAGVDVPGAVDRDSAAGRVAGGGLAGVRYDNSVAAGVEQLPGAVQLPGAGQGGEAVDPAAVLDGDVADPDAAADPERVQLFARRGTLLQPRR